MLLVDEVDDKNFLAGLFNTMYEKLPEPKKKINIFIYKDKSFYPFEGGACCGFCFYRSNKRRYSRTDSA